MTQQLELAKIAPVAAVALSPEQSAAWLGMATAKNQVAATLAANELAAQAILLPVMDSDVYTDIDTACAEYRKAHTEMIEGRKTFTGLVDAGIIQPLMAFEKRVDPKVNPGYLTLVQKSLTLRKEEANKAALVNAKNQEIARFKVHCANEFFRIAEDVRYRIRQEINIQYRLHLEQRLSPELSKLKELIYQVKPGDIQKFNTTLLTKEELSEIYFSLNRPDEKQIYIDGIAAIDTLFANFDSDLANAAAAILHQQEQQQLIEAEAQSNLSQEMAINTLIATSEAVIVDTPKIKCTLQVTVVESELWAKSVMAAFIINMQHMAKYIRVKSWSKLTIGQMAVYLGQLATDEGVTFSNLVLKEVEK